MFTYDELLNNLINCNQIDSNLRKTASEAYISWINREEFIKLALKYFGVDKDGEFTNDETQIRGYMCPYSGVIIDDLKNVQLDHIIPFDDKGGTVLFNCLPVDGMTNNSKNNYALLGWLESKGYLNPLRVKRITDYILEAYDLVFKSITTSELEKSYLEFYSSEYTEDERVDNLEIAAYEKVKSKDRNIPLSNTSYEQFLIELIVYFKKK